MAIYLVVQTQEYARDLCSPLHAIFESQSIHRSGEQDPELVRQAPLATPGNDTLLPKQNDTRF